MRYLLLWTWGEFRGVSPTSIGSTPCPGQRRTATGSPTDTRQHVFASAKKSRLVPARSIPHFIHNISALMRLYYCGPGGNRTPASAMRMPRNTTLLQALTWFCWIISQRKIKSSI